MTTISPDSDIPKPTLLITGAGGLLGHALCEVARHGWEVYALYHQRIPKVQKIHTIQAELTDLETLTALFHNIRPKAVVHAAAAARLAECQAQPHETEAINVKAAVHMAQLCADLGSDLCFTSTDLVFNGLKSPYTESAVPSPVCTYGRQKARAESEILQYDPQALVCRLPLLIGWAPQSEANFTVQMIDALVHNRPLALFVDEYRTPVDALSAALAILGPVGACAGRAASWWENTDFAL